MIARWWNWFCCYSLPLTILSFSSSASLMSSRCRLPVVRPPSFRYVVRIFISPSSLSIFPYLSFYHAATYSQFSNHCLRASPRYVKPLHCQDIQHMRMNDLHVSSQRWYESGHIWLWCIYCTRIDKVPVNIINHSFVLAVLTQPCGSDFSGRNTV